MEKQFIILIDFSENTPNLLRQVEAWCAHSRAHLLLLHQADFVVPTRLDDRVREQVILQHNNEVEAEMRKLALETLNPTTKFVCIATQLSLADKLDQLMDEPHEYTVFAGLKGTGILKRLLMGSMVLNVVENLDTTLVALPTNTDGLLPKRVHVAVGNKYTVNATALNNFLELLGDRVELLRFFHLATKGKPQAKILGQMKSLEKLFKDKFPTQVMLHEDDSSVDKMKSVASGGSDDILVVQRGPRNLPDQLFRKFLTNELVYDGRVPLVILP